MSIQEGMIKGSLPRRALKLVYEWLDIHKEELMDNWKRLEKKEIMSKIDPLE